MRAAIRGRRRLPTARTPVDASARVLRRESPRRDSFETADQMSPATARTTVQRPDPRPGPDRASAPDAEPQLERGNPRLRRRAPASRMVPLGVPPSGLAERALVTVRVAERVRFANAPRPWPRLRDGAAFP